MKLITEVLNTNVISEENGENKDVFIEGIFLQGEIINGNGRKYPIEVLEAAVEKYQPMIDAHRALGELNHPPTPQINYERAAIKTVSLIKEGNNYFGKAKLLSTPMGELCKGLVRDGVQLAVSSRGLGSIREDKGISVVQSDFTLSAAADVVSDPSAPDAFVQGIMEDKEWVMQGGILVEQKVEAIKKIANKSAKDINILKEQMFYDFIRLLKK